MKNKIKLCIIGILIIGLLWFIFRTVPITITYNGMEKAPRNANSYFAEESLAVNSLSMKTKSMATLDSVANSFDSIETGSYNSDPDERYDISHFYTIYSTQFDKLCSSLKDLQTKYKFVVKNDELNSSTQKYFNVEYNPRYKYYAFQIDSKVEFLDEFEKTIKQYGEIRSNRDEIKSVEAQISNLNDEIKNTQELLDEAIKERDKAKDDKTKLKYNEKIERYKERLTNYETNLKETEKKTTYITYELNIYEKIVVNINAIQYWYKNSYEVQEAVRTIIPKIIAILAFGLPIIGLILLFILGLTKIFNNEKTFEMKMKIIKDTFGDKGNFNIKV